MKHVFAANILFANVQGVNVALNRAHGNGTKQSPTGPPCCGEGSQPCRRRISMGASGHQVKFTISEERTTIATYSNG